MILPDVNLLLYAHNTGSARHAQAKAWWLEATAGPRQVGLCLTTLMGFLRLSTNARVFTRPLSVQAAVEILRELLQQPHIVYVEPGPQHLQILFELLEHAGVGGNLTTDAHLAALAIEWKAEIASTDVDFARFPRLRWFNPLKKA